MERPSKAFTKANAGVPPTEQKRIIDRQTEAFLANGGQIQTIMRGVSGQAKLGGPQMTAAADVKSTPRPA